MMEAVLQTPSAPGSPLSELTRVAVLKPTTTAQGLLPVGAMGTIMHTYADGQAYEVEFTRPFACLVTMKRTDLRESSPAH